MKFKKTAIALVLAAFAFSLAAPMTDTTVFAAKGGARISAPKAAPSTSKASPSTGATKASSPNTKEYAPSKSAKSYSNEAPAAKTGANAAAQTQSGSRWGSALRNIGLFAGGMMLGGLLSSMFGMGGAGMMSDILGLIMNVVMIGAVFMILRLLWNKFRGNRNGGASYAEARREPVKDRRVTVTPQSAQHQGKVVDILPPANDDYDPKRTADRYRNR